MEKIYLYLLYPIYTIWFASHASIINENLSYVGNLKGMRIHFILWAFMCAYALSIGLIKCSKKCIHVKRVQLMILISAFLFLTSVLLPYLPEYYPIISEFHESMAFIGLILLLVSIAYLIVDLKIKYNVYPFDYILIMMYAIALAIYGNHFMSVNSLVEIFLGITLPIYLVKLGESL